MIAAAPRGRWAWTGRGSRRRACRRHWARPLCRGL